MKEIITLQLGHNSNFLGTHYWNAQNDSQNETLFCEGKNFSTPRLCLLDRKGVFRHLNPRHLAPDTVPTDENQDTGFKIEKLIHEPAATNEYIRALDSFSFKPTYSDILLKEVNVWSDFNYRFYHPRSLMEISTHTHNDPNNLFSTYTCGQSAFTELNLDFELFEDRLRLFMEDSDLAQGFQIFCDVEDGFSGLGSRIIQEINEEYPKKSCFVFGVPAIALECESPEMKRVKELNKALFMHDMLTIGSLYVPLSAPTANDLLIEALSQNLKSKFESPYLWTSYLAAAIDTITMPFR